MFIKMSIVKPENSTIKNFHIEKMTKNNKIIRTTDKVPTKLFIKLLENQVMFLPQKYDRLVLELNESNITYIKEIYEHLKQSFPIEYILKNENQLSLKIDKEQKEKINDELKYKDVVDVVVVLDQVYTMNKLNYVSVQLHQYKKQEQDKQNFF